jgi:hypothetical protein
MAKTPTAEDVPNVAFQGDRPVATYDVSAWGQGAQALARGVQNLGQGVEVAATDIAHKVVDQEKSQAILGENVGLGKAIELRQKYKDRTDYGTFPQEHADDLAKITSDATAGLPDGEIKDHVLARLQIPFAHERAAVAEQARNVERQVHSAYRAQSADFIVNNVGADDNDQMTGSQLHSFGDTVDYDVEHGRITPEQGRLEKRNLAFRVAEISAAKRIDRGDAQGVINETRDAPVNDNEVTDRILQAEGQSKNPHSTATGTGQFIDSTWLGMIRQHRPDLAAGRSDADILALRSDKGLGREMTAAYASDNGKFLRSNGVEATPGNTYLAHFLGPAGAAAVAKADPNRPVIDVLSDAVGPAQARRMVEANRSVLQGKLAGSVTQWSAGLMGGRSAGSGSIFDVLSPEARMAIRQRAETALANKANRDDSEAKLDEYNLKGAISSDLTSMGQTGQGLDDPPSDRIRTVLGADTFQRWQDARTDAHTFYTATHDFDALPESAIQSRLDLIAPAPGDPDYARKQAVWENATKRADQTLKLRRDDPAGSMSGDSGVRAALGQYDQNNPETFKPVAAARMAAQERAGIDEEYRSPITKDEALKMTEPLRTMLPGQERAVLTEVGQKFKQMFGDDADKAFAYALRAHKVDAQTAQIAARVMRKLQLGQAPTEGEAAAVDETRDINAADRAVRGLTGGDAADTFAGSMGSGIPARGIGDVAPAPSGSAAETYAGTLAPALRVAPKPAPFGPNLPDVKPRAIDFLLKHPDTAAAFDREYAQPGLAKKIIEKYSTAVGDRSSTGAP